MDIPQPWVLSTDRTEWSFGATRFNILMLGIVHNGVPYPLVWEMLDKKGNSNSSERMDLMDRFSQIFPDAQVAYLTGDREFVGKQWLTYLLIEPIIPFRLRIGHSDQRSCCLRHRISDGKKELNRPIKVKKHGRLAKSIFRYGLDYLRSIVTDLDLKHDEFCHSLQFLSCT